MKTTPHLTLTQSANLMIVGLGASAGGLKALLQFFEKMPTNSGMAFVVILHLSPNHESHTTELLQNVTGMHVIQVIEPIKVEPNTVYVIPPTKHLSMNDGKIVLTDRDASGPRTLAVDLFFRTLAEAHREKAISIVLSGSGSDGTNGIKSVKEEGGITIVQDPEEAEYDSMPRNAINTGFVDFVMPVAEMPEKLVQIQQNASLIKLPSIEEPTRTLDVSQSAEEALREILSLLRARTGHDFMHYKRATVLRRIERRLQVNQLPDLPAYRDFLRTHAAETRALFKDMLISVTNFFRDREAFEALEQHVIPKLFINKTSGDQIRVWTAGCATGEEAYSLAILLCEYAESLAQPPLIQVFASEIDEDMISTARDGVFPESIVTDVSPARLHNYFIKEPGRYRVKKSIREKVLFATHNLIKDPPFSKLDLISCRNLLIYLNREMQEQILSLFHFALKPGGFLFLGSSESTDGAIDLFSVVDKRHRIFQSKMIPRSISPVPALPLGDVLGKPSGRPEDTIQRRRESFSELHQKWIEQYAPPSVIINLDYEIVHLSDRAGRFLQFVGGEPSHNLLKVVHPELRLDLRTALFQALQSGMSVEARRVRLTRNGRTFYVNMIARPVRSEQTMSEFILVLFDEVEDTVGMEGKEKVEDESEPIVRQLEEELHRTKEQLQGTIEQYETSTEELRASNEELQAINEELRSTTEELETSKEELQSINEELSTVNHELKNKVDEISSVNDYLQNLIASTDIATIFLDRSLRIKRFTPRAPDIFNLIPSDIGRSLLDITHRLKYEQLSQDTETVLSSLQTIEREVQTDAGRWYIARLLPYRTLEDKIDGAVLTFIDITERKRAEDALRTSEMRLKLSLHSASAGWWDYDFEKQKIYLSAVLCQSYNFASSLSIEELKEASTRIHPEDRERVVMSIRRAFEQRTPLDIEFRTIVTDGGVQWLHARGNFFFDELGHPLRMAGISVDITGHKNTEEALIASEAELMSEREMLGNEVRERTEELEKSKRSLEETVERIKGLLKRIINVQENERKRISRDLHDLLDQQMKALRLGLESLNGERRKQPKLDDKLTELLALAEQLGGDFEILAWELSPFALDDLGLEPAIANYIEKWSKHSGLRAQFRSSGLDQVRVSPEIAISLYRILQEALNNILKHAQATHVSVTLERRGSEVLLVVEDDGIGFRPGITMQTSGTGLGLPGMRERAALADGTIEIESAAGKGTTIFVRMPAASANE